MRHLRLASPVTSKTTIYQLCSKRYASSLPEAYLQRDNPRWPEVAVLHLNRPQAKNAISRQLLGEFRDCLEHVKANKQNRVLIVTGSHLGAFCAGADLAERRTMSTADVNQFLINLRNAISTLEHLDIPTIAAIDGPALGGGLELALACDLRVAGHQASKIGLPETKLGIIPGAGGTQRLARLLGVSKAKELIFTGRALNPNQALEFGVVDYVTELSLTKAFELAEEITTGAPLALRAAKLAISQAPELSLEVGLDFERACYQPLLATKDRLEALAAFKEKRKPVFKGE